MTNKETNAIGYANHGHRIIITGIVEKTRLSKVRLGSVSPKLRRLFVRLSAIWSRKKSQLETLKRTMEVAVKYWYVRSLP